MSCFIAVEFVESNAGGVHCVPVDGQEMSSEHRCDVSSKRTMKAVIVRGGSK